MYCQGTDLIASSDIETIVGIAIKAKTIEPENAVNPVGISRTDLTKGTKVTIPTKPKTTLGIAAISSTIDFKISLICFGASSAINNAVIIPNGTAIIAAPTVTSRDPIIRANTPYDAGSDEGYQYFPNTKLIMPYSLKKANPSFKRKPNIKTTKIIAIIPHKKIIFSII